MKKIINKKIFNYVSYLSVFFIIIAMISPFFYPTYLVVLGSLFLGISLSLILQFFFTTKEEERKKIEESRYKKSREYYFYNFLAFAFILVCLFFVITYFSSGTEGDEWATDIFPYRVSGHYIIIPGILAGICFRQANKFKKKVLKKNK